ncbi:ABC transporter permease [Proteiniclasticum ruminis]|uniref:Osmoprotectant transport system permease protein n=1 Tax=Proteiniclasticum ruminis TaxID=398199 RepID=A0A1I5CGS9_9CLOT|nr:ABC transporter permease [Proteiniclasticum ruminis]SFN86113.1 osmoprotectant transport system permease protein [Proteiniclasticum ruminis]
MTMERVLQHLYLVGMAAGFTIIFGLVLGILTYLYKPVRPFVLWTVDILQTIPVLALLGVLSIVAGSSSTTVIIGIVLYSLLPVVRNTYVGLTSVDPAIKEAATGMGMTKVQKIISVELQLAFPMIFTGIRIAIVTSIGTAVFGAVVGGGGLGSVINRAILIQDMDTLLEATLALMVMAVVFDFGMGYVEKRLKARRTQTLLEEDSTLQGKEIV